MRTIVDEALPQKLVETRSEQKAPLYSETIVSWVMNREVISVRRDMSLTSLESLFVSQDLSRVPVIDDSGTLIGVVSKTDLVTHHIDRGDGGEDPTAEVLEGAGLHSLLGLHIEKYDTVADVMSQVVVTVTQATTVARAAELMFVNRVHGLPVVSSDGKVIGWVSSLDILSWVAGMT